MARVLRQILRQVRLSPSGRARAEGGDRVFARLLKRFAAQLDAFMEPDPVQRGVLYRQGLERTQPLMRKTD